MVAQTIFTYIQKEIHNDEDSQTNSTWKNHSSQEKSNDFRENMGFLEMKGTLKETMCRTQVTFYHLKEQKFSMFLIFLSKL